MAETTRDRVTHWGGTWLDLLLGRSRELAEAAKKKAEEADRLKARVRQACEDAGIEYAFFGKGDGVRRYTQADTTELVVDEARLKEKLPELYAKCLKTAFSPEVFFAVADATDVADFSTEVVKRRGAERFDSVKSVEISDIVSGGKPFKYDGSAPHPDISQAVPPLLFLTGGPLSADELMFFKLMTPATPKLYGDICYFSEKGDHETARRMFKAFCKALFDNPDTRSSLPEEAIRALGLGDGVEEADALPIG